MDTEQQIINDIKQGRRDAMRLLYNRYSGYAMAIVMRYVPDRDDCADILQDAFVKILTSIGRFEYRGEGSLKSWISRIVANEALLFLRSRGNITFTDNIPDEVVDDEPDIEGVSDEELQEMISALPTGYRIVLNMYVFGQMSHKEIASQLGISASTSASQYFHAKKMLAKMIRQHCADNATTSIKERRTI